MLGRKSKKIRELERELMKTNILKLDVGTAIKRENYQRMNATMQSKVVNTKIFERLENELLKNGALKILQHYDLKTDEIEFRGTLYCCRKDDNGE